MTQLDRLRAALKYSSGADRQAIRAMILEIECGLCGCQAAEAVDPEPKPPEAHIARPLMVPEAPARPRRGNVAAGVTAGRDRQPLFLDDPRAMGDHGSPRSLLWKPDVAGSADGISRVPARAQRHAGLG